MKVYVLTCCDEYGNETPAVFDSREKAENALGEIYDNEISTYDEEHAIDLKRGYAYIIVDGHPTNFNIHECEVK